jgi:thioester reductase-like protein
MNIVLTGITGILGSQVFYELLKREDIDCFFSINSKKRQAFAQGSPTKNFKTSNSSCTCASESINFKKMQGV